MPSCRTLAALPLAFALTCLMPPAAQAQRRDNHAATGRALKPLIEKHLEIAHLLTSGMLAHQNGEWAAASASFEALLARPDLPADVAAVVRPLAEELRAKYGGGPPPVAVSGLEPLALTPPPGATLPPPSPQQPTGDEPAGAPGSAGEGKREKRPAPPEYAVSGTISGGGPGGPGGAVVMLRRADGKTPKPAPALGRSLSQKDKKFTPHVMAVPVGSKVSFRNKDEIFHNVFSIGPVKSFDSGLKQAGESETVLFDKAGPVELLCNIHASMNGWLYVVDTPWYAVADGAGAFKVEKVPAGEYEVVVWHEAAREPVVSRVTAGPGAEALALTVGGDKRSNPYPPDKYGKPRQSQLGY